MCAKPMLLMSAAMGVFVIAIVSRPMCLHIQRFVALVLDCAINVRKVVVGYGVFVSGDGAQHTWKEAVRQKPIESEHPALSAVYHGPPV